MNSVISSGEPVERGRSLPRNIEAPPASSTPLSAAGVPASSWGAAGSAASPSWGAAGSAAIPWAASGSAASPWVVGGGVSASPLLKKAQINVASRAAKEEVKK